MTTNAWTVESVAAEAAKYTTRTKFSKGSTEAYRFALSHNLLDTICGHMAVRGRRTKWTKELCAEEAKKYTSRSAFMNGTPSAYMAAYHCKWMDEFFPVNTNVWTVESVSAEATKYTTRTEFFQGSGSAYRFARAHNLLDTICNHMVERAQLVKWTKEACAEEAKKYTKRSEFMFGSSGAYKSSCRNKWLDEFFPMITWTADSLAAEAANYTTRSEFKNSSYTAYKNARAQKLLDIICSHMTPRSRQSKWNKEACAVEAKKYKSRAEFHKYSSGAYQISSNYKWLDEFFPVTKQNWTIDSLAAEASKYTTRTEFNQGSGSAYRFARAQNLLDSICGHMITPRRQYKLTKEARAEEA